MAKCQGKATCQGKVTLTVEYDIDVDIDLQGCESISKKVDAIIHSIILGNDPNVKINGYKIIGKAIDDFKKKDEYILNCFGAPGDIIKKIKLRTLQECYDHVRREKYPQYTHFNISFNGNNSFTPMLEVQTFKYMHDYKVPID